MIEQSGATRGSGSPRLPLEGRHDPARPTASTTCRWRPAPTPSNRPTSTSPRRSAASTSRSRSSLRRWTPSSMRVFAGELARLGGLAVLNLEGVQTRYDDPDEILGRIADARPMTRSTTLLAEAYQRPIREDLIARPAGGDPRRGLEGRGRRDTERRPPVRPVLRGARRGPVPRPEPGQQRSPPRHRTTTRCRSPSSPGTCRSRSRSATRPTPRRPSR